MGKSPNQIKDDDISFWILIILINIVSLFFYVFIITIPVSIIIICMRIYRKRKDRKGSENLQ